MNKKQKRQLKRIIISAILMIIAAVISRYIDSKLINLAIFAVPYLIIGGKVLKESLSKITHGQMMDENFLMTIATIGAFALGEYLEGVAVMLFFNIGELFESYAVGSSRKSISALMDIRPEYANLIKDGKTEIVDPEMLSVDDVILVKPGERVPVDGVVTDGTSTLDTSALTGESAPREITVGDPVTSGCINISGVLNVRVTKVYADSTVAKILELVENSGLVKSRSENFITKFARIYTPVVVFSALALALIPPIFVGSIAEWISRALIFLVVSCPCALVISVPLSFFAGIGGASKNGILVKGSTYLEALSKTSVMMFDKTGTLTEGKFTAEKICPKNCVEEKLLMLASAAEYYSNHPIAQSIKSAYGKDIDKDKIESQEEITGCGIHAVYDGKDLLAGNSGLMDKFGIAADTVNETGTVIHAAYGGKYLGYILIRDSVKPDSASAIKEIKKCGIDKCVMLTGDKKEIGEFVANEIGIDECHSELLPADKVSYVEKYLKSKKTGTSVAFVGDGINDAPVLARADIGIAMGGIGSDAAIEAADIVLMDDMISKIPVAVRISRKTLRIVSENITFALAVKAAVLILSVFGLTNMWAAVFADVGVSVIAILNAMRALK